MNRKNFFQDRRSFPKDFFETSSITKNIPIKKKIEQISGD